MNETIEVKKIGIADLNICRSPNRLRTSGLGSCVGIVIYDLNQKLAGMAHIMLPDSTQSREKVVNRYKYADTAISDLIDRIQTEGGRKFALKAKIAGGSQMFQINTSNDAMRVGQRNVESVLYNLSKHYIPVVAKDIGGNYGRTIEFNPDNGLLNIRTFGKGEIEL